MRVRFFDGISLKVGSQYVCWNSYKAEWYLGKKRNSELFGIRTFMQLADGNKVTDQRAAQVVELFSPAKLVFVNSE